MPKIVDVPRAPTVELTTMTSLWSFAICGIDLIGSLLTGKGGVKYAIVDVDYFTKWTEAEPLASITTKKSLDFVIKNIVCIYGLVGKIVSNSSLRVMNSVAFVRKMGSSRVYHQLQDRKEMDNLRQSTKLLKPL